MQNIVFYVAANETLGRVRDYSNMRNSGAPLLTLGVAVCLRMRLFEDIEDSTPYPIDSFSGITDWQWRMDADFDRSTACKLVADADGISVHTVTETVKGETMSFTEFVIPISNMNTEELVAWLGIDKDKTGLAGELVGYDNEGHAAFVLQIEDFSVRNRLAGLNEEDEDDPTPVDQEIVTRPVAEQMIQTAVSTLDAAKQDKLNSANAGTGISISSAGVITAESVPQSAVAGLSASLAAKQDKLNSANAGTGISISSTGVISTSNVPQSAVAGLSASLAAKQDKLNSANAGTGISISSAGVITAESVPQSAVAGLSASLAAKQDKLNSANAGTGISISSTGVISTSNVPQSAVVGLESALAYKQNALSMGFWIEIDDDWISVERYHTIHGPYSSGSVTLQAGEAFKIYATNSAVTLNKGSIPNNTWGLEGHVEIFVANTGYIHTGSGVVLANALEPDAVNNCTVRFHDGYAIISVEDHVAGYIVTVNAASGAGSLAYGLATATNEYISVDASLNGQTLDLAGATTYAGEKHVVGNGYTETIVSGGITCTSKTTFSNLSMQNVAAEGGTMTLGDVYIPNGATVTQTDGRIGLEHVSGFGTIDFAGGSGFDRNFGTDALVDGVTITGATTAGLGGVFHFYGAYTGTVSVRNCTISGNMAQFGAVMHNAASASRVTMRFENCLIDGNTTTFGGILYLQGSTVSLSGCTVGAGQTIQLANPEETATDTRLVLEGETKLSSYIYGTGSGSKVNVVSIQSGAFLDLTGNTNGTPIAPGSEITFAPGGATVLYSSGAVSGSYMMDNVILPVGAMLTNTAVVDLGETNIRVYFDTVARLASCSVTGTRAQTVRVTGGELHVSDCTISGVTDSVNVGGVLFIGAQGVEGYGKSVPASVVGCHITGNRTYYGCGGLIVGMRDNVLVSNCLISGNSVYGTKTFVDMELQDGAIVDVIGSTIGELGMTNSSTVRFSGYNSVGLVGWRGSSASYVSLASGATIDLAGNTNATPIAPGGGVIVDGGCTVINSAGASVSIAGGTYTQINNDGTTE